MSKENLSVRKMFPGGYIFLENFVLLDRIYCPPQYQMSPCKISHCVTYHAAQCHHGVYFPITCTMSTNWTSWKWQDFRARQYFFYIRTPDVAYYSLSLVWSHYLTRAFIAYTASDILTPYKLNSCLGMWDYSLSSKSNFHPFQIGCLRIPIHTW